jgi:ankyrin repeat protein
MSRESLLKSTVDVEMMTAIALGDVSRFERALSRMIDLDAKDSDGLTPLMMCIESEQWPMVGMLLDKGASCVPLDHKGRSALYYALRAKHEKVCLRLLALGADQCMASNWLGVNGPVEMVENLLAWDGWSQEKLGFGVLGASRSGRSEVLALFLKAGASPDALDDQQTLAVEHAAIKNSMDCVKMLIDSGANLQKRYNHGADIADISEVLGARPDIVDVLRTAIVIQYERDDLSRNVAEGCSGSKIRL